MVSGVSFKGASGSARVHSKNKVVGGKAMFFLLGIIVLVVIAWVISAWYLKSVHAREVAIDDDIVQTRSEIDKLVNGAPREYVVRSRALGEMLYLERPIYVVAQTFGKIAVPGVVLKELSQSVDETGIQVEVTADASQYDEVSAQISAWKSEELFSNVRLLDMSRDDETNFILFSAEITLAPSDGDSVYGSLEGFSSGMAGGGPGDSSGDLLDL